jgi:hypothetical protein
MDVSTIVIMTGIIVYGVVQYYRRERLLKREFLYAREHAYPPEIIRGPECSPWVTTCGAVLGFFMLLGMVFMADELKSHAAGVLFLTMGGLAILLLTLAALILLREIRGRRARTLLSGLHVERGKR